MAPVAALATGRLALVACLALVNRTTLLVANPVAPSSAPSEAHLQWHIGAGVQAAGQMHSHPEHHEHHDHDWHHYQVGGVACAE